jgi:hypothetical protein
VIGAAAFRHQILIDIRVVSPQRIASPSQVSKVRQLVRRRPIDCSIGDNARGPSMIVTH